MPYAYTFDPEGIRKISNLENPKPMFLRSSNSQRVPRWEQKKQLVDALGGGPKDIPPPLLDMAALPHPPVPWIRQWL